MSRDSTKILSLMFAIGRRLRDEGHPHRPNAAYSLLHFQTLRYVQEERRPLVRDVARYLCVTPSAATLLVEGLTREKLLARSFDKKDRRAVRLRLTKRGKQFLARGLRLRTRKFKKVFSVLTAKERGVLMTILEKVLRKLS